LFVGCWLICQFVTCWLVSWLLPCPVTLFGYLVGWFGLRLFFGSVVGCGCCWFAVVALRCPRLVGLVGYVARLVVVGWLYPVIVTLVGWLVGYGCCPVGRCLVGWLFGRVGCWLDVGCVVTLVGYLFCWLVVGCSCGWLDVVAPLVCWL